MTMNAVALTQTSAAFSGHFNVVHAAGQRDGIASWNFRVEGPTSADDRDEPRYYLRGTTTLRTTTGWLEEKHWCGPYETAAEAWAMAIELQAALRRSLSREVLP